MLETAYGLSFAQNDFKVSEAPYETFNLLSQKRDTQWRANRAAYQQTSDFLDNSAVHGNDLHVLEGAVNEFTDTMKPIVESRRFEKAGFAIEDSARKITNNKMLAASISNNAALNKHKSEIYEQDNGWTNAEKDAFTSFIDKSYTGVGMSNGVITGGFYQGKMADKVDYQEKLDEAFKGFMTEHSKTMVDGKGNLLTSKNGYREYVLEIEKQGLNESDFVNYMSHRFRSDPAVLQSMETASIVDSQKSMRDILTLSGFPQQVDDTKSLYYDKNMYAAYQAEKNSDIVVANKYESYDDYILKSLGIIDDDMSITQVRQLAVAELNGTLNQDDTALLNNVKAGLIALKSQNAIDDAVSSGWDKYKAKSTFYNKWDAYNDKIMLNQLNGGIDVLAMPSSTGILSDTTSKYGGDDGYSNFVKDKHSQSRAIVSLDANIARLRTQYGEDVNWDKDKGVLSFKEGHSVTSADKGYLESLSKQYNDKVRTRDLYESIERNAKTALRTSLPVDEHNATQLIRGIYSKLTTINTNYPRGSSLAIPNANGSSAYIPTDKELETSINTIMANNPNSTLDEIAMLSFYDHLKTLPTDLKKTITNNLPVFDNDINLVLDDLYTKNKKYNEKLSNYLANNLPQSLIPNSIDINSFGSSDKRLDFVITKNLDAIKNSLGNQQVLTNTAGINIANNEVPDVIGDNTIKQLGLVDIVQNGSQFQLVVNPHNKDGVMQNDKDGSKVRLYITPDEATTRNIEGAVTESYNAYINGKVNLDANSARNLTSMYEGMVFNRMFDANKINELNQLGETVLTDRSDKPILKLKRIDVSAQFDATNKSFLQTPFDHSKIMMIPYDNPENAKEVDNINTAISTITNTK